MMSIEKWPSPVVGFKVGGIPQSFRGQYPAPWQVGPMFKDQMYHVKSGESLYVTVYEGGFAAYEAEFVFAVTGLDKLTAPVETIAEAKSSLSFLTLGTMQALSSALKRRYLCWMIFPPSKSRSISTEKRLAANIRQTVRAAR